MNPWLCDTNVISELMRREPFPLVADWFRQQEMIHVSVVTVEEIHFGLRRKNLSAKLCWFEKFTTHRCLIVPVDMDVAVRAGNLRGNLAAKGDTRSQADLLIAATAAKHNLVVVTRNIADFSGTGVPVFNPFDA